MEVYLLLNLTLEDVFRIISPKLPDSTTLMPDHRDPCSALHVYHTHSRLTEGHLYIPLALGIHDATLAQCALGP